MKNKRMLTMGQLEMLIYLPFCWLWIGSYILSSQKEKIQMDLDRFYSVHYKTKPKNYIIALHNEFVCFKEFRSIFMQELANGVNFGHGLLLVKHF